MNPILQIFLLIAFLAGLSIVAYKWILPLINKFISHFFKSVRYPKTLFYSLMLVGILIGIYVGSLQTSVLTATLSKKPAASILKALENKLAANGNENSITLDHLIEKLQTSLTTSTSTIETSFDLKETTLIIAALDREYELYQKNKSTLSEEELLYVVILRDEIKEMAAKAFGDESPAQKNQPSHKNIELYF